MQAVWTVESCEDLMKAFGKPSDANILAREMKKEITRELLNDHTHYFTWTYSSAKRNTNCSNKKCKLKDTCCTYCKYNESRNPKGKYICRI